MGALKQQKEVLSGLFYTDNDLLCRKGVGEKKKQEQSLELCVFAATLSISPCEDINQKLVVFRF